MSSWTPERGVFVYRQRFGPTSAPLRHEEPPFPWDAVPLLGLGVSLFFAGLALIAADWRAWEGAVTAAGVVLVAAAFARLLRRFL